MKKIVSVIIIVFFLAIVFGNNVSIAQQYVPMEAIPGSGGVENISSFPAYVQAIYKFAIWSVGIAALLMISMGGFMYITAAGNNSQMESAKKVISDALFGLVAVMVAAMILYKINPDLININLDSFNYFQNPAQSQQTVNPGGGQFGGQGSGGGW